MAPAGHWCPLCSFLSQGGRDARALCARCEGDGEARCGSCLCLDCAGTGRIACPECDKGRIRCPDCDGSGKIRGFLSSPLCRRCSGTGLVYHDSCSGTGLVSCPACAGLTHLPGCPECESSGTIQCTACFGLGLSPSPELVEHAGREPLARLMEQLPVQEGETQGEILDAGATLGRTLAFLALYHWSAPENIDAWEHEMHVLRNRLHLRIAFLTISGQSSLQIDYRFLTIVRTGESTFRVRHAGEKKAFR